MRTTQNLYPSAAATFEADLEHGTLDISDGEIGTASRVYIWLQPEQRKALAEVAMSLAGVPSPGNSLFNPKLTEALTGKAWADGYVILATLRGPDGEDEDTKATFTGPIRRWVFSEKGYQDRRGHIIIAEEPLTFEKAKVLYAGARAGVGRHFFDHVRQALRAIARLEGWGLLNAPSEEAVRF